MDPWIVCMYVCMYAFLCVSVCVCVCVCVCACVRACVFMYAYSTLNFVKCFNMGYHTNITYVITYSLLRFGTPIFLNQHFPRDIQQNTIWFLQENSVTI